MNDMPTMIIPLERIHFAPWNYKETDERMAAKLQEAMRINGYISKMVVANLAEMPDENFFEVIDGNHRLKALQEIGVKEAQAIYAGLLDLPDRQRIGAELNELRFASDHLALADVLDSIRLEFDVGQLEKTMPYSQADFAAFARLKTLAENPGQASEGEAKEKGSVPDIIKFKFGVYTGDTDRGTFERFTATIQRLQGGGIKHINNQIEALCASYLSE